MNQIICDICGSEYPEGYDRCPTCSYPRQGGEKIVAAGAVAAAPEKVKGGRFSAKNVKKRRKAQKKAAQAAEAAELAEAAVPQEKQKGNPNRPLWITILILLLAIILVTAYIAMRFGQGLGLFLPTQTEAPTTAATSVPTETTVPPTVPCAGMTLETAVIALDEAGQQHQIGMKLIPENTTDVLSFVSQDPAIAQVDSNGMLTAVGSGQTTITITCGQIVRECTVVCWFEDATTAPVETTAPTAPPETTGSESVANGRLKLDQEDVSCFAAGESFSLYAELDGESVSRSKITWRSSDPKVAKVDKGTVTSVSKGMVTITAEYNGMKAECIVRCRFENTDGNGSQAQGSQENAKWKASHTDVSISVGESFRLKVTNSAGETAKAIWTMDVDGVVAIDGRTVTGRAPGIVTLTTEVEGVTMTCIVRVR